MQPGQGLGGHSGGEQGIDALPVASPRSHGAHVGQVQAQRGFQQRDVELGVVGEDAGHGPGVDPPRRGFLLRGSGAARR